MIWEALQEVGTAKEPNRTMVGNHNKTYVETLDSPWTSGSVVQETWNSSEKKVVREIAQRSFSNSISQDSSFTLWFLCFSLIRYRILQTSKKKEITIKSQSQAPGIDIANSLQVIRAPATSLPSSSMQPEASFDTVTIISSSVDRHSPNRFTITADYALPSSRIHCIEFDSI